MCCKHLKSFLLCCFSQHPPRPQQLPAALFATLEFSSSHSLLCRGGNSSQQHRPLRPFSVSVFPTSQPEFLYFCFCLLRQLEGSEAPFYLSRPRIKSPGRQFCHFAFLMRNPYRGLSINFVSHVYIYSIWVFFVRD